MVHAFRGVDYVFSCGCIKQVPSASFFLWKLLKPISLETDNVLELAIENNIKKVIMLINRQNVYQLMHMGISKAMMEKCLSQKQELHRTQAR